MVSPIQRVNKKEQPEAHHGKEMAEDGTASGRGYDVIRDGHSKRRHVQTNSIVNPKAAEGCTLRTGNEFWHKIPDRVSKQRKDNPADDVPGTDIEMREPGS